MEHLQLHLLSFVCLVMAMTVRVNERVTVRSFGWIGIAGQCLLHLANYYAVSSSSDSLGDRIDLCYLFSSSCSSSSEPKAAHKPSNRGDFSLRDFHHAVRDLPMDAFFPNPTYCCHMKLSNLLQDQLLYSWGNEAGAVITKVMDVGFVDLTGGGGGGGLEDEWEQLVVTEIPSISLAPAHSSTSDAGKHTDGKEAAPPNDKTLKILERPEVPNRFLHKTIDVAATTNKLIRPNFQRLNMKQK